MKMETAPKTIIVFLINLPLAFLNILLYTYTLELLCTNNIIDFDFRSKCVLAVFVLLHFILNILLLKVFRILYVVPIIVSVIEMLIIYYFISLGMNDFLFNYF